MRPSIRHFYISISKVLDIFLFEKYNLFTRLEVSESIDLCQRSITLQQHFLISTCTRSVTKAIRRESNQYCCEHMIDSLSRSATTDLPLHDNFLNENRTWSAHGNPLPGTDKPSAKTRCHLKHLAFLPTLWHSSPSPLCASYPVWNMYGSLFPGANKRSQKTWGCGDTDTLNGSLSPCCDLRVHL